MRKTSILAVAMTATLLGAGCAMIYDAGTNVQLREAVEKAEADLKACREAGGDCKKEEEALKEAKKREDNFHSRQNRDAFGGD